MESKAGSDNTGKIKGLINALRKNKEFAREFHNEILNRYGVEDKRLDDWRKESEIVIPRDAKPQQCIEALIEIDHRTQIFSNYHREAKTTEAALRSTYEKAFDTAFESCYNEALAAKEENGGKRLPAKDTLTALADRRVKQEKYALHHAQIATMFFQQILNKLNSQREDVKSILIALGIEAKMLQQTGGE